MARMIVADHDYVTKRYNLHKLKELEELVADAVQVYFSNSSFKDDAQSLSGQPAFQQSHHRFLRKEITNDSNPQTRTDFCMQAFTHKAGIHAKAILKSEIVSQ